MLVLEDKHPGTAVVSAAAFDESVNAGVRFDIVVES